MTRTDGQQPPEPPASPELPEALAPSAGEQGLLADWDQLRSRIDRAWDLFGAGLVEVDLAGPTRSRGHRARDLLIPLGAWPDARGLHDMVADARHGRTTTEPDAASRDRLRAAHADATAAEVAAAVEAAGDSLRGWAAASQRPDEAGLVTPSPLGIVPVATMLHAAAFQLAVVARDLEPAGMPALPELDALAVVALLDSSGAVAARLSATASIAAVTPQLAAGTGARPGCWRTVPDGDPAVLGPAVLAPAGLLIDTAAGRVDLFALIRQLRVRDGRALAPMAVVLDGIPDLPAAALLRRFGSLVRR